MKKHALFINCPNLPLFMKKKRDALLVPTGCGLLVGSIKHYGTPVDFFDFNLALNNYRSEIPTPWPTIETLNSLPNFLDEYYSEKNLILRDWINYLLAKIDWRKEYVAICLSLDNKDLSSVSNRATLAFAFLLAKEMKKQSSAPILLGGNGSLKASGSMYIPHSYQNEIKRGLTKSPIDIISEEIIFSGLGKFIAELHEGKEISPDLVNQYLLKEGNLNEMADIVPSFEFNNMEDILVPREEYLPEEILKLVENKYPKLREIEPFFIAPHKFTIGCPYTCAFCHDGVKDIYYQHRVEKITNTFYELQKKGVQNFAFFHNNINLNLAFLKSWREGMQEAGVKIKFSDSANLQNANDDFFSVLQDLGCTHLWYGTETVSDRLLKYIDKDLSYSKITKGLECASKHEIWNSCNFIYNFPFETEEDFKQLVDFIRDCDHIDSYETNEYRLVMHSPMGQNPAKYGIELITTSDNKTVGAFNEINGKKWHERIAVGQNKKATLRNIIRPQFQFLTYNDYLVFGMKSIGMKKQEMKEVVRVYSTFLRENKLQRKFGEEHLHHLPRNIFPENFYSNTIQGRSVSTIPLANSSASKALL